MSSESNRRLPAVLLGVLAGLVLGLLAAWFFGREETPTFERILTEADHSGLGNARIQRMLDYAESLEAAELGPALDRVQEKSQFGNLYDLTGVLYARWTELDLEGALRHAESQSRDDQRAALGNVLKFWAAKDATEAWKWFEANGSRFSEETVGNSILREIARDEPEKAIELHAESAVLSRSTWGKSPSFIYGTWALKDPAAAAAHLEGLKNHQHRREAISNVVRTWTGKDPDAAWQWSGNLERKDERLAAMNMVVSTLVMLDLERAESLIAGFPQGDSRKKAIDSVIGRLAMSDPEAAYALATEKFPEVLKSYSFSQIFSYWVNRDAEQAYAVARDELESGPEKNRVLQDILNRVADSNIDRAIEMFEEVAPEANLTLAAAFLGDAMAKDDIQRAVAWAEKLPAGEMRRQALTEVLAEWLVETPVAAAEYALGVADDPQKELLRNTLTRWSHRDAAPAVQWAHKNLEEDEQRRLLPSAVAEWGGEDLMAASGWVEALPSGDLRDGCLVRLAYEWASNDPTGGEVWLGKLKPGSARDQAVGNFAHRLFDRDPDKALEWAGKIEDERRRKMVAEQTARRYLRDRPEKARQSIRSSSLPDEMKKSLLEEK